MLDEEERDVQDDMSETSSRSVASVDTSAIMPESRPGTPFDSDGEESHQPPASSTASLPVKMPSKKRCKEKHTELDIELQKLATLKQMSSKVLAIGAKQRDDPEASFGNQVATELRQIKDISIKTRVKRNIMTLLYDAQDSEINIRSPTSYNPAAAAMYASHPHTLAPTQPLPHHLQYMPPQVPQPCFTQMLCDSDKIDM